MKSELRVLENEKWLDLTLPMGSDFKSWDEFDPALYNLEVRLKTNGKYDHTKKLQFGMRSFKADGSRFSINGRPTFLRGNVNCAAFPLTGYPPMDVHSWEKLFSILKDTPIRKFSKNSTK